MSAVTLSDEQLEQLADMISERLTPTLISAAELAQRLGCGRDFVYANSGQFGAIKVGKGERPRLLFPWPLRPAEPAQKPPEPVVRRRPRRRSGAGAEPVELLRVKGRS